LANGMKIVVQKKKPKREKIENRQTVFIEEGGRQEEARFGIRMLAQEIKLWQQGKSIDKLNIFLPSGTGTTALFLQKYLTNKCDYEVLTTPCVGDVKYLEQQFLDEKNHPTIIQPRKKYHFGKLYKENYKIWLKLQEQTGVVFDLLYDPLGWRTLLAHPEVFSKPTLYIHQGGVKKYHFGKLYREFYEIWIKLQKDIF